MNKAQKRLRELETIENTYTYTLMMADQHENNASDFENRIAELEDNDYSLSYWQTELDKERDLAEAYRKLSEQLLKMM